MIQTTIEKIKDMQLVVTTLLERYPEYRDSDKKLISHVWMLQFGGLDHMKNTDLLSFLKTWINSEDIANPDTISRARRKVQENRSDLRGENYTSRHKEEINVRNNINKS